MASSPVSHHKFHSVQWCLKETEMRIKSITQHRLKNPAWEEANWFMTFSDYEYRGYIFLPFCFCRKSIVLCNMVDLSIFRGWPWPCSIVHSSLMSTLNWSLLFFSDLLRDALQQPTHENNYRSVELQVDAEPINIHWACTDCVFLFKTKLN